MRKKVICFLHCRTSKISLSRNVKDAFNLKSDLSILVCLKHYRSTSAYLQELQHIRTLVKHLLQLVEDDVMAV